MAEQLSFLKRLMVVVLPTRGQALSALFLSMALLTLAQAGSLLEHLSLPGDILVATQSQLHARFEMLLSSPIASQIALVGFWAIIGLVAYLICWGAYNVLVEARNEVTLSTSYTNRGRWRGTIETLVLKSVSALGLALIVNAIWASVSLWLTLSSQIFIDISPVAILALLASIVGFAIELYLVLAFAQLTFTPWYRGEIFTEP